MKTSDRSIAFLLCTAAVLALGITTVCEAGRYKIEVSPDNATAYVGDRVQLKAFLFKNGRPEGTGGHKFRWFVTPAGGSWWPSDATRVGRVYWIPANPGRYTITVHTNRTLREGTKGRAVIVVKPASERPGAQPPPPRVTPLQVTPNAVTLNPGQSVSFNVSGGMPGHVPVWNAPGGSMSGQTYTAGNVPGTYRLVCRVKNQTAIVTVTIHQARTPTAIQLTPANVKLQPGQRIQFQAQVLDQHNRPMPGRSLIWQAGGGAIGGNGVYTAGRREGTFAVTVRDATGISAQATVVVESPRQVSIVTISPRVVRARPGQMVDFDAVAYDQFNMPMPSRFQWSVQGGGTIARGGHFRVPASVGQHIKVIVTHPSGHQDVADVYVTR